MSAEVGSWDGDVTSFMRSRVFIHSVEIRTCTFSIMPVPMPILTRRPLNRTSEAARWTARSALSTTLVEVLMEERWWPMSSVGQGAVSSAC